MYLKKKITGLKANTDYEVQLPIDRSKCSNHNDGNRRFRQAKASTSKQAHLPTCRWFQTTTQGHQSSEDSEMFSIGNVSNFEVVGSEYRIKTLENRGRTVTVSSDEFGQLWLIVGTDSGFEGLRTFYYSPIEYQLTIVE